MAEVSSERLASALEEVRLAAASRDLARAAILPHVTAKASHFRQEDDAKAGNGASSTSSTLKTRDETKLTLDQPLFQGFRDVYVYRGAGLLGEASRLDRDDLLRALRLEVSDAYAQVLAAEARIAAVGASLARARDRLEELRARLEVGLVRRADVLSAEAQASRQEALRVETGADRATSRAYLAFLIGEEVPAGLPLAPLPAFPEPPSEPAGLLAHALERRMDLAALERRVRVAEDAVRAEKASRWPAVGLTGNAYGKREGQLEDVGWDLEVTGSLPLFEGGASGARIRQAASERRKAELSAGEKRRQIAREVEEARHLHAAARASLESLRKEAEAAEEGSALLEEECRQGIAPYSEQLTAQDTLLAARVALVRQELVERVAALRLWSVLGEFPRLEGEGEEEKAR